MAKRYYAGSVSLGSEHYAGMDSRRAQERSDSAMLSEDAGACANLPQNVKYHDWKPGQHFMSADSIDDTKRGIDSEQSNYQSQLQKGLKPRKA